jgi:hypothetical protein
MAQKIEGPVTVTHDLGARETLITASSILVGRTVVRRGGARPALSPLPGRVLQDAGAGDVVAGDNAPRVPAVSIDVGDRGNSGGITVRDEDDRPTITLDGRIGLLTLGTGKGAGGQLMLRSDKNGPVILMNGKDGRITFLDSRLKQTLAIDGVRGDIELIGADCAEDFDMSRPVVPGTVLTIDEQGLLGPCQDAYDRRVVGVVSGAGGYRPGLRLDRGRPASSRQPLALLGKVFCLVDADQGPVVAGDLLTTSDTDGHAMRAADPERAIGAVLGKSLGSMDRGRGLLPVLVTLQ